jgi:hypothetical protein
MITKSVSLYTVNLADNLKRMTEIYTIDPVIEIKIKLGSKHLNECHKLES